MVRGSRAMRQPAQYTADDTVPSSWRAAPATGGTQEPARYSAAGAVHGVRHGARQPAHEAAVGAIGGSPRGTRVPAQRSASSVISIL